MDLLTAIRDRRSVREYKADTVGEPTLRALIDAAIVAPTAVHREAWSFVVVANRAFLKRCSDAAKGALLARLSENPQLGGFKEHLGSPDFNIFYDAPALIIICATEPDPMAAQSACLAAENLMLCARGMGLGSCWIGFAEAWLSTPAAATELSIPRGHIPIAPIIVGYPTHWPESPGRRAPTVVWVEDRAFRAERNIQ
jgi:nitroreductase